MRKRRRSGFTLVELVIGVTILAVLSGAVMLFTTSTSNAYRTVSMSIHNDAMARRGMRKVKELLRGTGADQILPMMGAGLWTDTVEFQQVIGQTGGVPEWAPLQRLELQEEPSDPDDGLDNDDDGLIDERVLVWIRDSGLPTERPVVLLRNVSELLGGERPNGADDNGNGLIDEPGACFDFDEGFVTFRLTTQQAVDGTVVMASYQTGIRLLRIGG